MTNTLAYYKKRNFRTKKFYNNGFRSVNDNELEDEADVEVPDLIKLYPFVTDGYAT